MQVSQCKLNKQLSYEGNKLHIHECNKILNRVPEFTPQGYERMSFFSKAFLRKCTPIRMQELAKTACDIAFKIKNKFDNQYGENNYMIIAVGRSIASLTEILKFIGVNSTVIPLSELRFYLPAYISDIDIYKKYLDQIGLTREKIRKNPDTKFILMDYAVSGDSLSTAKEFLEKQELLGKSDNFIDREINPMIKSLKTIQLFYYERFKNFSPVGKLPLENLKDVFIQSNSATSKEGRGNICQYVRKLFLFNVLDVLKKNDFHNFMPSREIGYIERYESPEYRDRLLIQNLHEQIEELKRLTNKN